MTDECSEQYRQRLPTSISLPLSCRSTFTFPQQSSSPHFPRSFAPPFCTLRRLLPSFQPLRSFFNCSRILVASTCSAPLSISFPTFPLRPTFPPPFRYHHSRRPLFTAANPPTEWSRAPARKPRLSQASTRFSRVQSRHSAVVFTCHRKLASSTRSSCRRSTDRQTQRERGRGRREGG